MRTAPALLLLVAACSSSTPTTAVRPAAPTPTVTVRSAAADAAFAAQVLPHHEQALVMAQAVLDRGADSRVKALAQRIKSEQGAELPRLRAVLTAVGATAGHEDHDDDLAALASASGEELDALFLDLMVTHHEGALRMADAELRDGTYPEARALATEIKAAQTKEIAEMRALLSQLNG